jgi:hypothetical protein
MNKKKESNLCEQEDGMSKKGGRRRVIRAIFYIDSNEESESSIGDREQYSF